MNPIEKAATDWAKENAFRHIDDQVRAFTAGAEWALKHGDAPIKERDQTIAMLAQQLADKKEIIRRLTC